MIMEYIKLKADEYLNSLFINPESKINGVVNDVNTPYTLKGVLASFVVKMDVNGSAGPWLFYVPVEGGYLVKNSNTNKTVFKTSDKLEALQYIYNHCNCYYRNPNKVD